MSPCRHRPAAWVLLLALLPPPAWPAPTADDATTDQLYRRALKSSVWVLAFKGDLNAAAGLTAQSGTGWVLDVQRRLIVTNYHIVRGMDAALVCFPTFRKGKLVVERNAYVTEARTSGIEGKILVRDEKRDLAVIQLRRMPDGVLALPLAPKPVRAGQTVYSLGNPGSEKMWCFFSQKVADVAVRRFASTSMSPGAAPHIVEARVIRAYLPAKEEGRGQGESGGPLVNAEGELVGVTQGGALTGPQRFLVFIAASEVRALLRAKYLLPSAEAEPVARSPASPRSQASAPPRDEAVPGSGRSTSEAEAAVQLRLARQLVDAGRLGPARERLRGLIRKYPKTEAAGEARQLLAELGE